LTLRFTDSSGRSRSLTTRSDHQMTSPSSQELVHKIPVWEGIAVVLGNIVLALAAILAGFLGSFFGYGALESTLPGAVLTFLLSLATFGPIGIVLASVLWGYFRLLNGKSAWWIAGLGIVALIVNFNGTAAAIGS